MTQITDRLSPKPESHSKFWQNAHLYFDRVYQTMNLDPLWRASLSSPKRVLTVSCPIKMDGVHPRYAPAAPLGADTAAVLAEVGVDADALATLRTRGAI